MLKFAMKHKTGTVITLGVCIVLSMVSAALTQSSVAYDVFVISMALLIAHLVIISPRE